MSNKVFDFGGIGLPILNQKTSYIPSETPPLILDPEDEKAIALSMDKDLSLLLIGEAGTGKTSVARYLAYKKQQGYTRINMHGYATPDELIGSKSVKDGATYYENGTLTHAMIEGHITVLDEINATPADCLFVLHGLLDDDKRITLPNGDIIRPHKDFRFIATMNPDYEGTKSLNRALIDRFPIIIVVEGLQAEQEAQLLITRYGIVEGVARNMVAVANLSRKNYREQKTLTYISTRTLLQWSHLIASHMDIFHAYEVCITNKARIEEKTAFNDIYYAIFKKYFASTSSELVFMSQSEVKTLKDEVKRYRLKCEELEKSVASKEVTNEERKRYLDEIVRLRKQISLVIPF